MSLQNKENHKLCEEVVFEQRWEINKSFMFRFYSFLKILNFQTLKWPKNTKSIQQL